MKYLKTVLSWIVLAVGVVLISPMALALAMGGEDEVKAEARKFLPITLPIGIALACWLLYPICFR